MKRILTLLITAMLLVSTCAFAEEENWYLETAKELTSVMGELAGDEGYLSMYTLQKHAGIDAFTENDFSEFSAAWQFYLPPQKGMQAIIGTMAGQEVRMGDLAWEYTYSRMMQMIPTQHNDSLGTEQVIAATILNYSRTYIMPEGFTPCAIVLAIEKDISFVSFSQTGENTITATVQPIFCPEGSNPAKIIPSLGIYIAPNRTQLF